MPCFKQEKSLEFRSRRDKTNDRDPMAPKPVRPRCMTYHGLFGLSIAAQHLIVDDSWSPTSLTEEFSKMGDLLRRRVIYKRHEVKTNRKRLLAESKKLKALCADGRIKLQKIESGNNAHKIRNFLIKHRDMQRLYQKMPIHLIADNVNQRTFVMRKEKDRLNARLSQLKQHYKNLLLDRSEVQNRIKYENVFVLEEELQSRIVLKKIENSNVRMKAIRTINTTYKKMVQVMFQDEIFYEPILHSLEDDMEEQTNFIKHILHLGIPAIAKFRVLNHRYRLLEEKSRKNLQAKQQILSSFKKPIVIGRPDAKVKEILTADPKRYVRETQSMEILKQELQTIEKTIKELKLTVLCSQAREIYPRVKNQLENNELLHRNIENDIQSHKMLETKINYSNVLSGVLVNNLSEEEINRLQRISELKGMLKDANDFEMETLDSIKNRSDIFVTLRLWSWHLIEELRHVDRNPRAFRKQYPNTYLKLPLLKFDLLDMFASPPEFYEEDVDQLMYWLKRKVYKLMKSFQPQMNAKLKQYTKIYHDGFMTSLEKKRFVEDNNEDVPAMYDDLLQERNFAYIPSRKQIKAQSSKLVEAAKAVEN